MEKLEFEMKKIFGKGAKSDKNCPLTTGCEHSKPDDHSIDATRSIVNKGMEYEKCRPLAYMIYDYMKKYAVGYENRVKSNVLMEQFNITNDAMLRSYIREIRQCDVLQKIICSDPAKNGGYWIATNEDDVYETMTQLYNRAMDMLKTYSHIRKKCVLNNQLRMKLNKYEKEIYESIMEEK